MSGLGPVRWALRGLRVARGVSALVALLVLVAAGVGVGAPRLTDGALTSALHSDLAAAGSGRLALEAALSEDGAYDPEAGHFGVGPVWSSLGDRLAAVRKQLAPLGDMVGTGEFAGTAVDQSGLGFVGTGTSTAASNARFAFEIEAAPSLRTDARLVTGRWPGRVVAGTPLEVVMSAAGAATMRWHIGQTQTIQTHGPRTAVLVGTVAPRDPDAAFWGLNTDRAHAGAQPNPDGTFITYHSTIWVDPGSWPGLVTSLPGHSISAWYPIDANALTADRAVPVAAQVRRFMAEPVGLGIRYADQKLAFRSDLPSEVLDFVERAGPSTALIALFALGPAGALAAVLLLGLRLLRARRSGAEALARARGAAGWQLRLLAAAEVAAWTLPAAIAGGVLGILLTPGDGSMVGPIAAVVLCALVPPLAAAALAAAPGGAEARPGIARAARIVAEAAVVIVAVLALVVLVARGPASASSGADPLVEVAPLLLAVAVTVMVLRLTPLAGARLAALLRRGGSASGLVTAAAARRPRRGGAWALFALVVGVGMSVFSLTMVATQQQGVQQAALGQVGSDVAVNASRLTAAQVHRLASLPGVAAHATIQTIGQVPLAPAAVAVYAVDPAALADVQRGIHGSPLAAVGGTGAVVAGVDDYPSTARIEHSDHATLHLHLVDSDTVSVVFTEPRWMLIDRARLARADPDAVTVAVLLRLRPGADPATVAAAAAKATGPAATVRSAADAEGALVGTPLDQAVHVTIVVATLLAALLCLAVFVATLAAGSAERLRRGAILRALGFGRGQTASLVVADVAPIAIVGVVAGALTGIGLAAVVLHTIDPAGFVGSPAPPALVVDAPTTALAVVAFLAAAAAAVAVAVILDLRRPATAGLQTLGEER